MTPFVPQKTTVTKPGPLFQELNDLLLSSLEFLGATAGWIGLQQPGGLSFPARIGVFSDSWLPWQQAHGSVWGFTINDETTIRNDLRIESKHGDPPLCNLLSVPLVQNKQILGHIALANKVHGFSPEDALVLRGLAQHVVRLLGRRREPKHTPIHFSAAWRRVLDRATEGIILLEESGILIYVNAAWLDWTGFRAEDLLGRTAPFPFWVSQHELVQALTLAPAAPAGALPFRRHDQSLFWCAVETAQEQWDDHLVTIAFLRQMSAEPEASAARYGVLHPHPAANGDGSPSPDWLPLLLDLDHGIEGWDARWEERTGLSVQDVKDSRCELVLDWLFPQQHDRNRVADCFHRPHPARSQLTLEVASSNGSRPMLCTFFPLPAHPATATPRRWLLLVGEVERQAEPELLDGMSPADLSAIWRSCRPLSDPLEADPTES